MNKVFGVVFCIGLFMAMGCQKDYSVETNQTLTVFPTISTPSKGSLQDESGNCYAITVNGVYTQDSALTTQNFITVTINFTKTGKYKLYTDTVNGCWFSMDSATTYNTGIKTVNLKGNGTPTTLGTSYFNVFYLNSFCSFSVITNHLSKSEKDYFPMSLGSSWRYDTLLNASSKDTVLYTVTSNKQLVNGTPYTLFSSSKMSDTKYYYKDYKGHYYENTDIFSGFSIPRFEFLFLDDTKKVGDSWQTKTYSGTFGGAPVSVSITTTVMEKNVSYRFNNQTIDSVIHLKQAVTLILNGQDQTSAILPNDVYYAKKIGLVSYASPTPDVYRFAIRWNIK